MANLIDKKNVSIIEDTNEQLDLLEKKLSTVYVSLISVNTEMTKMLNNMTYMQERICEISNIDLGKSKLGLSLNYLSNDFENMYETAKLLKEVLRSIDNSSKMKEQMFLGSFSSMGAFSNVYNVWKNALDKADFSNVLNEIDWSQMGEELGIKAMKMIRKGVFKKFLGKNPIPTTISAVMKAMGGNQAAKSALSLMFKPLSSYIPWLMLPEFVDYHLNLAKETADLTEKIEELGYEEGRIVAGTGIWDKAAVHQYDIQKANADILYAGIYGEMRSIDTGSFAGEDVIDESTSYGDKLLESWFSEESLQEITERLTNWFEENVVPWFTVEKWSELIGNIKTTVEEKWDEFTTWFNETAFGKWMNEEVLPWFTKDKWLELINNIKTAIEQKWGEFTTWFNETAFGKWLNEEVLPWFTKEKWLTILEGIEEAFPEVFTNGVNGVGAVLNRFIDWINEKLRIEWDALYFNDEKVFDEGAFQLFTIPNIPKFSVGGFPEDGLFMANHGELVGKFTDGRTVVANNEQIIEGIKTGVKDAVSEVLAPYLADIVQNTRETADKEFTTYIGDKEIARASERGRRAMGVQLIT